MQVFEHLLATGETLQQFRVTPGGIDVHLRLQHVGVTFEAQLVVAASGRAVAEHVATTCLHGIQQTLDHDGPANAGGIPVPTVVARLILDHVETGRGHFGFEVNDDGFGTRGRHLVDNAADVFFVGLGKIRGKTQHIDTGSAQHVGHGLAVEAARNTDTDLAALQVLKPHRGPALWLRGTS